MKGVTPFFIQILVISSFIFLISCDSPFFPNSGGPRENIVSSPNEVVSLLQESYERQDLVQFRNLIYSEDEFRSYILLDGLDYSFTTLSQRSELLDSIGGESLDSINSLVSGRYATLYYDDEIKIHSRLFSKSESIRFKTSLLVKKVNYFDVPSYGEFAIVETIGDSIMVKSPVIPGGEGVYAVDGQVFCMKKDGDDSWKIWKWFEVN
jgi:hypothetical protein